MNLQTELYQVALQQWPTTGKHILAQFNQTQIVVYQAYRPEIARYAAQHGRFGEGFSFNRMTWIKPNFLWMMYRSGWASKEGQERILALTLKRSGFDQLLAQAVASSYQASHLTPEQWQEAVAHSDVRLQWDPDHAPNGAPTPRRAIQLGIRGGTLREFNSDWLVDVQDITPFVLEQRQNIGQLDQLIVPAERVYPVADLPTIKNLGMTPTE